jgi:L-amino acid N-acyltransferase YncA
MSTRFRLATPADAAEINGIYGHYCLNTPISFEVETPSLENMQGRIAKITQRYPWIVCERHGEILGYVYAMPFHERAAYIWSVTTSVYIRSELHRSGVGRGLYASLFRVLALQGFHNALAGITLPNPASIGLHQSLGFVRAGVYPSIGYKLGSWYDVEWMQLELQPPSASAPPSPMWIDEAQRQPWWTTALHAGLAWLKV